eukprot:TRINITY_DN506_c0_g1_i15.p1 TRINITY_DN506_c0_g1~~TRINITY_DN506_c0_g1_i15.p1  ORF type:complete len:331 (-),score=93.72 TRINITY_DN506_c0_g1_i15:578-1519(-)
MGFSMGSRDEAGNKYLNNHVAIVIKYIEVDNSGSKGYQIVGFEVTPSSLDYEAGGVLDKPNCKGKPIKIDEAAKSKSVAWTYSVTWKKEDVAWADRWDRYVADSDAQIHWFSIINSLMIVLFLTGMVAMIMVRTLHADFRKYSAKEATESGGGEPEETGWKLLHGDVFRPPRRRMLLSALCGFGSQVFAMAIITLLCGLVGLISPIHTGSVLTGMIVLFVLMGVVAGYNGTRLYKMMKGADWKMQTVMIAFLVPGIIFGIFLFINFFLMGVKSSGQVPFISSPTRSQPFPSPSPSPTPFPARSHPRRGTCTRS